MEVFGLEDHFPFFSWVMAVGEPAGKNLPGCSHEIFKCLGEVGKGEELFQNIE